MITNANHHKGQHVVPRCYLKYFSFDKQENPHAYVYDKVAGKPYPTSLSKICVEEDIYTPSEKSETGANLTIDDRRKCYEVNYLKKEVEDKYSPRLEYIISKLSINERLTVREKMDLSHFIAIQFLRQPNVKTISQYFNTGLFSDFSVAKHVIEQVNDKDFSLASFTDDKAEAHYKNAYGNKGTINILTCLFGCARWEFLHCPHCVYTSDNPVLAMPRRFEIHNRTVICGEELEMFVFPITCDYLLTIEINPNASFERNNACVIRESTKDEILRYNLLQYICSKRYTVSIDNVENDYEFINKIPKEYTIWKN